MQIRVLPILSFFLLQINVVFAAQTPQNQDIEKESAFRLSEEFLRAAHKAAMSEPLDTLSISAAEILIQESTILTPENISVWEAAIEVSQMADNASFENDAIRNLLAAAPNDTTPQLSRLRNVVEQTNTVDQRMAVYEQLLSEGRSLLLDARVASRLAFDAALLQRQVGNIQQFARWLAESVALDPAYPEAMVLAAGFFGDDSADVFRRAELLAAAVLSNIRDTTLQVSLAEFLMAYGDYKDASAMYAFILEETGMDEDKTSDSLLADVILSRWATGDVLSALDMATVRQTFVDKKFRKQTKQQQPRLTPLELARIHAPLSPKLSLVRAVIFAEQDDKLAAKQSLESTLASMLSVAKIYATLNPPQPEAAIGMYLKAAWITLWLSNDIELANSFIETLNEGAVLDQEEKTLLDGWIALRSGNPEEAIQTLSKIPDNHQAQAGSALAHLALGNKRTAATLFLTIAKQNGGSILGVWSKYQLKKIVDTDFNIRPEITQLQEMMVGLFRTINSFVLDPRPELDVQITATERTYAPYEPILIDILFTNNTTIPLAVAKNGPIQPYLLIDITLEIPQVNLGTMPPIIVPINKQLSIFPRETVVITTDLRQYWPGGVLNAFSLRGASMSIRSITNFHAREATNRSRQKVLVYEPGALGTLEELTDLRIDGVRLTNEWLKSKTAMANKAETIADITAIVQLTWVVGYDTKLTVVSPLIEPPPSDTPPPSDEEIVQKLKTDAIKSVLTKFPQLGPMSQAWILSTMSNDASVEAVIGMQKEPTSTVAQIARLIRFASYEQEPEMLDDPFLLEATQSENKKVRTVAKWVYADLQKLFSQPDTQ